VRVLKEHPFTPHLPFVPEPYPNNPEQRHWAFHRNIIRNNLNMSAECRQRNDHLLRYGAIVPADWEATDRLHHARVLKLIHTIGDLPPNERRELEDLIASWHWPPSSGRPPENASLPVEERQELNQLLTEGLERRDAVTRLKVSVPGPLPRSSTIAPGRLPL
jgi:hypothetical protein